MSEQIGRGGAPATVEQVAAAIAALGLYDGENSETEHAEEAARLGGAGRVPGADGQRAARRGPSRGSDGRRGAAGPRRAARGVGRKAREALQNAMDNTDLLLNMLKSVGL